MSNEAPRWVAVVGYESLYEVSDAGQVRRVGKSATTGKGRGGGARRGRILKEQTNPGGYKHVQLWKDGVGHSQLVHGLVAPAFLGPAPDGYEINHRDGVKAHNGVGNLEYLTRSENLIHGYATGLYKRGKEKTEAAVAARRRPRLTTSCECGCGAQFETPTRHGYDKRFVIGHGGGVRRSGKRRVP